MKIKEFHNNLKNGNFIYKNLINKIFIWVIFIVLILKQFFKIINLKTLRLSLTKINFCSIILIYKIINNKKLIILIWVVKNN